MRTFLFRTLGICGIALALACDSGSTGPGTKGPEFFKAAIDNQVWAPQSVLASCSVEEIRFNAERFALPPGIPEVILIQLAGTAHVGSYVLGDSSTGRSASWVRFVDPGPSLWYNSASNRPGRVDITGMDFQDSVVAGTFRFDAVAASDPTEIHRISGSFRAKWIPVFTTEHPDTSPCSPPPN